MDMPQSAYDIISLHNIDDEDFVFEYDKSQGNYPHVIPAGEIKRLPRFLARHATKHLIDKILTKRGERISNENLRESLANQIVIEEETFQTPPQKTEAELQNERIKDLNKPSDLDAVLIRNKEKLKERQEAVAEQTLPIEPKEEEKFEGLEKGEEPVKGDEVDTTDKEVPPAKEEVKPVSTRKEIYKYAVDKLDFEMTDKMKARLDKMSVQELLKEVGNPQEALA